jgi:hypothetical protein
MSSHPETALPVAAKASPPIAKTRCPPDMAPLPLPEGGCIDRYEASCEGPARVCEQARSGHAREPSRKPVSFRIRSVSGAAPLGGLTVDEAAAACARVGKALCTEHAWRAACEGAEHRAYPYGEKFEPRRCNDWDYSEHGKKGALRTGALPNCRTEAGVFDLANNVGELTSTPEPTGRYVVRGGTYFMTISDSRCDEDDYTVTPEERHPDVGFRCCAQGLVESPAPGQEPGARSGR